MQEILLLVIISPVPIIERVTFFSSDNYDDIAPDDIAPDVLHSVRVFYTAS